MTTKFTKARRFGQDEAFEDLKEMIDDPDTTFGDLLAGIIESASDEGQLEVGEALRDLGMDSRGHRRWAKDRLERRRMGKDADARLKRFGRDGLQEAALPKNAIEEGEDRRRMMAGDIRMALDGKPQGMFKRFFPNASPVERA